MRVHWNTMGAAGALLPLLLSASCASGRGASGAPALEPAVAVVPASAGDTASAGEAAPTTGPDTLRAGYTRTARGRMTDAVGSITQEELETMRVARVEDLLRGRMAGVQVERDASGEATIRIRNASTLGRGSGEPLLVLDGMAMNGQRLSRVLEGIAPSDIARIDVLKDAGATAPYGMMGANGVILITTKRQRAP